MYSFLCFQNKRNTISIANLDNRTTSPLEGINSYIQRTFPTNTTIFQFVDSLKLHETRKSTDLYQLSTGSITNPELKRRAIDQERDEKIKYFSQKLKTGKISIASFLISMADRDLLPPGPY